MADHLVKHLAEHADELRRLKYVDKRGDNQRILAGNSFWLLQIMCELADEEQRTVACGMTAYAKRMDIARTNILALVKRLQKYEMIRFDGTQPSRSNSLPINRYQITLPGLPPLESKIRDNASRDYLSDFSDSHSPNCCPDWAFHARLQTALAVSTA